MSGRVDPMEIILADLSDIKATQKEISKDLSAKVSAIHRRIDDLVHERHQCELTCKERDVVLTEKHNQLENLSKDRDNDLEKKIFRTSGITAGAISGLLRFGEWIITVIIK